MGSLLQFGLRIIIGGISIAQLAWGQTASSDSPRFEVVSIRQNYTDGPHVFFPGLKVSGNRVKWELVGLEVLFKYAFGVDGYALVGLPGWARSAMAQYDIEAIAPEGTTPAQKQLQAMFQNLLADRFQLKFHREARNVPIYNLVVGKKGPKLKVSTPGESSHISQGPQATDAGVVRQLVASRVPMAVLRSLLSDATDRPIFDKTGLNDFYDITLQWDANEQGTGPSIFTAVQEQLGLKLESSEIASDVMVVEHLDMPSDN